MTTRKKTTLLSDTSSLIGETVNVYFNLNTRLWSIKHKGKIVAHVKHLTLKPLKFHVSESGRQRVIARQCKEVHAWIKGTIIDFDLKSTEGKTQVSYNPYLKGTFYKYNDSFDNHKEEYNDLSKLLYFCKLTKRAHILA